MHRREILLRLIERFGYTSYLEIGVAGGATFRHIPLADKTGVDPRWRRWSFFDRRIRKTTSDRFFARNRRRFDLVFVDGLHVAEQADRDITHALAALHDGGTVVVHDCYPRTAEEQAVPRSVVRWTGDVWRAFLKACLDPGLNAFIFDTNYGCGVIRREPPPADAVRPPPDIDPLSRSLSWEDYAAHRHQWQRIHPPEEIEGVIAALGSGAPR